MKIDNRCFAYETNQRTNITVENPIKLTVRSCFDLATDTMDTDKTDYETYTDADDKIVNKIVNNVTKNIKNRVADRIASCVVNKAAKVDDYTKRSDEELLLEFRQTRQRELFEVLVRRYERELFNYIRHYVGDVGSAEDVFQLTFMQVYLKCDQFEAGRKFRPWLYAIATNKSIDLLRVRRRVRKRFRLISIDDSGDNENGMTISDAIEGNSPDPLNDTINDEEAKRVREAMERLPENLRKTLYLVYFQGLPYREAAEALGIPFGTIKSRLNQAISKLNSLLNK
jgi:RNA polymerase sigma-70 factor (ECF subfamily)